MAKIIRPDEVQPTTKKIPGLRGVATELTVQDDGPAEEVDEFNDFVRRLRREGMKDLTDHESPR